MARDAGSGSFRSDIEGLRAIAVLGVLAFHAGVPHLAGGYAGVDVFYVISGYLITLLMMRDLRGTSRGSVRAFLADFYARRARRILPAATVVLVATLVVAALVQNPLENATVGGDARATGLFVANIRFASQASDYFAAGSAPSPFLQYWSLSVEEQYYVIWPLVLFVLAALARPRRSEGIPRAGLAVIAVASFAICTLWMRTNPIYAFYLIPARAWELALGAMLALYEDRLATLAAGVRTLLATVGLLAIAATMILYRASTPFPGVTALLPTVGTALVIGAGCGGSDALPTTRLLSLAPLQLLGRYSYSLYLWHWPVLMLRSEHLKRLYATWPVRTAFMLAVSLPLSALTYALIENPARRARWLRVRPARALGLGLVLIALAVTASLAFERFGTLSRLSTTRRVPATAGTLAPEVMPTDFVPANLIPALRDTRDRTYVHCGSPCVVGDHDAARTIVLFGNSHAEHWAGAFDVATRLLGVRGEVDALGGCPSFLIPLELVNVGDRARCEAFRASTFARLAAHPPDVIVLSNLSLDAFHKDAHAWEQGVRDTLRELPSTSTIAVLAETPRGKTSIPLCLARHLDHAERCDQEWPAALDEQLARIVTGEGKQFIDLRARFCRGARCPAITQDMLIYADRNHMTVPFARAQGEWLASVLRPLLAR